MGWSLRSGRDLGEGRSLWKRGRDLEEGRSVQRRRDLEEGRSLWGKGRDLEEGRGLRRREGAYGAFLPSCSVQCSLLPRVSCVYDSFY